MSKIAIGTAVRYDVGYGVRVTGVVIAYAKGEYEVCVPTHTPGTSTVYVCRRSDFERCA